MKIYLAARMGRRNEMRKNAEVLEGIPGMEVVSDWYKIHVDDSDFSEDDLGAMAEWDLVGVGICDCLLIFTENHSVDIPGASRGGRFVEMGYALAKGKRVVVIGPLENVFCRHPGVDWFENFNDFLRGIE